ncbi:hypothetical protein [Aeromicrobium chenweiae]|uniref:Uncharacterized protein n=1 Tax=Aeromicrobium chenweiae TaxID=2079793 RepID=A0A2S0WJ22_9ACTN|nr:hypothetical protein [Aeromicrobium chenweiae]AWB91341.1 hypothetical protein C3E78_03400 [Aeromicrobium chenweiae]TGN30727.1 hypothetical protein E4L97_16735 [Aeromicrobium chenweiae]
MNPRHRRLLIPGLLIALLVIVVVSSLADKAGAATSGEQPVSRITDSRITESSGLVVSRTDPDLAYTINDSGNAAAVYAVDVPSGRVVGSAAPRVPFTDTEALSADSTGVLWVADTGDNNRRRTDVALYSMAAFGRQDVGARDVKRFPLTYPSAPRDVESLVVNPRTDEKFLLTKGLLGGEVFALPDRLVQDRPNRVKALPATVPGLITDAAFTPDGAYVVARNYSRGFVLDASTWEEVETLDLPEVQQGETLAMEPDGRSLLVGSEGAESPLFRVAFTSPAPAAAPSDEPAAGAATARTPAGAADPGPLEGGNGFAGATWLWAGGVLALLAVISAAATRGR